MKNHLQTYNWFEPGNQVGQADGEWVLRQGEDLGVAMQEGSFMRERGGGGRDKVSRIMGTNVNSCDVDSSSNHVPLKINGTLMIAALRE